MKLKDPPPAHEAHRRLAALHATTFLLESRTGPERLARYSFVGWAPAGRIVLDAAGLHVTGHLPKPRPAEPALGYLRRVLRRHRSRDHRAPFAGGLVGCVGSDFVRELEPTLADGSKESWPRLDLGLYLDGVVYDHHLGVAHYVSVGPDRRAALDEALRSRPPRATLSVGPLRPSASRAAFTRKVRAAQRLVQAGECFQAVLSRAYAGRYDGDLSAAYGHLRRRAQAPHLFFLRDGDAGRTLLGASPETLVRVRRGQATTFPIAGTRPLTGDARKDAAAARALRADPKENAEHAMLVDLARNDLARVSRPGTVRVTRLRKVEGFRTVQHLVSEVLGTLARGRDALDALAAVFPAGTVSGAPKVRALEHIARLESRPRGAYAGAVCYLSFNGDLDSCIAIRCLSAQGGRLTVQAGAGIVLASDPDAEFDETRHKARLLLDTVAAFGGRAPREGV